MRSLATKKLTLKRKKEVEELYQKHKWYIIRLATYISSLCRIPKEDLQQEGFLGFLRAYELYKPEISSFLTYAQHWIRMAMYAYAYSTAYPIEIPEGFHLFYAKYNRICQEHNQNISLKDLAGLLKITETRAQKMLDMAKNIRHTSTVVDLADSLPVETPEFLKIESPDLIEEVKDIVTPEEYFVLNGLLALEQPVPKTLAWLGSIIGVTKERVRQIKNSGLTKLREALEGYDKE